MPRDCFDHTPDEQIVVLIETATLSQADQMIEPCEYCNPVGAEIPFDLMLDRITGADSSVTDYILEQPSKCPNCRHDIFEKTLIEPS